MALPVYMLCADSEADDKLSGKFSHFGVIEQINIRRIPEIPDGKSILVPALQFHAVASWDREDSDGLNQEFDYQFVFFSPQDDEELIVQSGTFRFTSRRYRLVLIASGGSLFFQRTGLFRVECRIRPVGASDSSWLVQKYSIPVLEPEPYEGRGVNPLTGNPPAGSLDSPN